MHKKNFNLWMGAVLALVSGCATRRSAEIPAPRPLGRDIQSFHAPEAGADNAPLLELSEPRDALPLRQALTLALIKNPELEAFSYEIRAAEARTLQADLLPNPVIGLEVESLDRDGAGYDSAEPSVMLSQVIDLGGKRRARVRVAEAKGKVAGWAYESKRLDVFSKTAQRFTDVIAAQQQLELTRSSMALAEQTKRTVEERVNAGKEPPLQKTKAIAEMEMARLDVAEAENALVVSRCLLAAMWGAYQPGFKQASGDFESVLDVMPSMDVLRMQLASNPELTRWESEVKLQQAALNSEQAARIPDLKMAAGVKHFEEDDTHAYIFGVGVPLPLFDRNQGNIAAAKHELAKARAVQRGASIEISATLSGTHARLNSAHKRALVLRSKVVPAMEDAYNAAHKGYKEGKFDFIDVLDAQRGLFSARSDVIEALSDYHRALNEIERLTGMSIEELLKNKVEK